MAPSSIEGLDVVGVARQSRTRDDTMSVADQIERMRAECERAGANLVEVYTEEDVSGRRPLEQRRGLLAAVQDVEAGRANLVMAVYLDRLVRSVKVKDEFLDRVEVKGGRVVALDFGNVSNGSAMEWLSSTQQTAFNEYYARATAERTAPSKQRNIDAGIPPFPKVTPAYRRREDGRLEQDPVGAPIILEAIRRRLRGDSFTVVTRWLAEQGIVMNPASVEKMFRSKLLVGELHFGKFTPNLHAIDDPLISHATYRRLNSTRAVKGRYAKTQRLLARLGVLRCGTCGARMSIETAYRGKERKAYYSYRCGNVHCSRPAQVKADWAEEVVAEKAIGLAAEVVGRASAEQELEVARVRRVTAEDELAAAIRTLAGLGAEAATKEVLDELQAARDQAVDEHERLLAVTSPDVTVTSGADWDRLTFDEKRDLVHAVVDRAVVTPGRGPGRIVVQGRGE